MVVSVSTDPSWHLSRLHYVEIRVEAGRSDLSRRRRVARPSVVEIRRGHRRVEQVAIVAVQRVEVDVLDGERVAVLPVELAASLGLVDVNPVRHLVARPGEPAGFDEGLEQHRGVPVGVVPVAR